MPYYFEERWQSVITNRLPPIISHRRLLRSRKGSCSVPFIHGASKTVLKGAACRTALGQGPDGWLSKEKFNTLLETSSINAQEAAWNCRRQGTFPEASGAVAA